MLSKPHSEIPKKREYGVIYLRFRAMGVPLKGNLGIMYGLSRVILGLYWDNGK